MSLILRSLACGLILSLALTIIAYAPCSAEEATLIVLVPRDALGGDAASGEEQKEQTRRRAEGMILIRVGPRIGVSGKSPFGKDQKEDFQQYDVAALFSLPWGWQERSSGLKFDMRLLASAGELAAAGATSLMATLVPCLAMSRPNGAVSIDVGAGTAFFSNYKFGVQNFGGPAQIVGTAGFGFNPFPGFYAGYRFQHFSDAGIYGSANLGVDMHILEIAYRF